MKDEYKLKRLVLGAVFIAIEILLSITPLGYIPVGVLHITTMHLPIILAGMILGPLYGGAVGFVFGLSSMLRATFSPTLTSFCFSPFITVGNTHGNFASLLIAFLPRIFLGINAGLFAKKKYPAWIYALKAGGCTFVHTLTVMGLIGIFFHDAYTTIVNRSIGIVIVSTLLSNGIVEIILAALIIPPIIRSLEKAGIKHG